ncbi:hypothetical protein UK23_23230 [Lentzea aerocolonigenes]|uniref:Uncharacterized protein n=1 Tax=Lentzea aerocolonigenes TaxID=68170 RepID=A0A0F0GWY9_LENAE|nr:hypothetical protein [Lentzea aerocolonigenes]KJK46517.1 hypothetical protein UK23_23230 [Lentzea aerocolonigenes]
MIPELSAIADDAGFGPLVRLKAAQRLLWLRRDLRSRAVLVAHEVAFDEKTPRHVRVIAAGCVAEWSDECREEARALILKLRGR